MPGPAAKPINAKPILLIDEYAISRLRFVCSSAAIDPHIIDKILAHNPTKFYGLDGD